MKNIFNKHIKTEYPTLAFTLALLIGAAVWVHNSNTQPKNPNFDKPEGFAEYFNRIKSKPGVNQPGYEPNYAFIELQKAQAKAITKPKLKNTNNANVSYNWAQRGPANVGGRTRCILIDPDDTGNKTWYAGSVSGGIWKTTNAGNSWTNLSVNIPNLATTTLAMAPGNHQVIYAGTGEGYGGFGMVSGNGILKTENKGLTWELIETTSGKKDFEYINKIIVDQTDENIVIVATNAGIFKTNNGGITWITVYGKDHAVQDIAVNPKNPNVMYAGVNRLGIIKSTNTGDNWHNAYTGMGDGKRFSIAVSPVDTSYIFSAAEVNASTMDIYLSTNGAQSWKKHKDAVGNMINFHGVQGWFNNVIEPHPYNKNKLFVGGVYLGLVEFKSNITYSNNQVLRVDTINTGNDIGFVNFGGRYLGGGMVTGLDENAKVEPADFTSIAIRFGPGRKQKAHRFTVPEGQGGGVTKKYYTYQDYIEVPFEVWDVVNNQQLMVSFRDQERDGTFNLVERKFDNDTLGREYLFIHSFAYDSLNPSPEIAITGGHFEKMIYFFWPTLPEDKNWNPGKLPEASIEVQYGAFQLQDLQSFTISDDRKNENLHVDHHYLQIIPVDESQNKFTILNANDGGVAISYNSGDTWEMLTNGYITTQFYGIAKKAGKHEYIGGMQDNGTWQSPWEEEATAVSEYDFQVEGDGFEALWHPWYTKRIIGSSYNNLIKLSMDGGQTWEWITEGLGNDGPFITRLSHSPEAPNVIFAIGNRGVYRHVNFGSGKYGWQLIELNDGWSVSSSSESSHLVEVSLANANIVWAGQGMYSEPDLHLFLSKDQGVSFEKVNNYSAERMGFLSGLATHPKNASSAYALFSMQGEPKILRTHNYGKTWHDISGFGLDSSSANGFPDVAVYSLLVMPFDTNTIWAGTEIGIFESTNNGNSWHPANSGLPSVSVWQMDYQDDHIIVATHGRGIWSAEVLQENTNLKKTEQAEFKLFPNPARHIVNISLKNIQDLDNGNVEIFNIYGQLVYNGKLTNTQMQSFNISDLSKGIYIVRATVNHKVFERKMWVE